MQDKTESDVMPSEGRRNDPATPNSHIEPLSATGAIFTTTIQWFRRLARDGGKGVVNNIDARSLGRIADAMEKADAELMKSSANFKEAVLAKATAGEKPRA